MENLFVKDAGVSTVDNLIYDSNVPVVIKAVTLVSGAGSLKRGAVLGKVTASGKYTLADKGAATGEQLALCILANDADATSADVDVQVYVSGMFNSGALNFKATNAIADHEDSLRAYGCFTKKAL